MMYGSWDIRHDKQSFFVILGHFLPFDAPNNLKNLTLEKMKKKPKDIIISHLHITNDDHRMYYSLDMERNRHNFLSFWTIFYPFTPPPWQTEKPKFWKNDENVYRYYHFTHVYLKWKSYDVWFLRYGVRQIEFFLILDHFLPFYPPNNPENQNVERMKKSPGDNIISHKCTRNNNHMMYDS